MNKRTERTTKGVQLDQESRAWQRKHYLDSLERDNFVARTEFEAIIATAEATAAVPGLANLNTTTFDVVQSAVGAAIGGGSSMAGVGLGQASTTASTVGGEQSLPHVGKRARTGGRGRSTSGGGSARIQRNLRTSLQKWGQVDTLPDGSAVSVDGEASTAVLGVGCGTVVYSVSTFTRTPDV
ncbi:hypothetical protein BGZ97_007417 [Linnemannia gamsii]|uniref:Uncharacterized protein n=1 Tax=Linnemannia gamsii TaxID=64522 RepID=A0A9P6RQ78_9FUNG|nr:hypothetical protein BGZ97_007417 [Linnemannia gamsii]